MGRGISKRNCLLPWLKHPLHMVMDVGTFLSDASVETVSMAVGVSMFPVVGSSENAVRTWEEKTGNNGKN